MIYIIKRDGRVEEFDEQKIFTAIQKCFAAIGKRGTISEYTNRVVALSFDELTPITVEGVQDIVERVLNEAGEFEAAREYILYREERKKIREQQVPSNISQAYNTSKEYFPTPIQEFQYLNKYARWSHEAGRRETWKETVTRCVEYLRWLSDNKLDDHDYRQIERYMLEMKAMPSMRLVAMAGKAAIRNPITIYNCAYVPVDNIKAFSEALFISMSGCGVGYSVERRYVDKLRVVREQSAFVDRLVIVVGDSAQVWVQTLHDAIVHWFSGGDVEFDFSNVRPAGAILKTKGGRASGPEPFRKALSFIREKILGRQGKKLRPIDVHDIMCAIGSAAVSGGMRRTAMLALFDFDDMEMMHCKDGDLSANTQRWNSNNSVVLPKDIGQQEFIEFFMEMIKSGRGEPGVFNRQAVVEQMPIRREWNHEFGCNPCGEVLLRPMQFCNLSIAIARASDNVESLKEKVKIAAIIGTIQAMATDFPLLRSDWRKNCEEERLIGVDITGHMDCPVVRDDAVLEELKKVVVETNRLYAAKLGINSASACTCAKPSGNSSVLLDCAPGIHARWSPYYIRNVRISATSPLYHALKDAKVPMCPENGQTEKDAITWVIPFPVSSPVGAIVKADMSALDQCEYWLKVKKNWAEHSVSCTVTYKPEEILDIMNWMWYNRNQISGITFLPAFDAKYDNMPYVEISATEYKKLAANFPDVDFARLWLYEKEDYTEAAKTLACGGGSCDLTLLCFCGIIEGVGNGS